MHMSAIGQIWKAVHGLLDADEALIWLVLGFYLFFFGLFLRYFWWKREAYNKYWRHRLDLSIDQVRRTARQMGRDLPFISILVPARGESLVIANTVRHLRQMAYPAELYEIIVVTDEKEDLAFARGEQEGPTTRQVLEALLREQAGAKLPAVKSVSVPYDFDGRLGGVNTGFEVKSTKGRALNYGMAFVDPGTEICAFYDAESRPEPGVLLYVAWRYLQSGTREQIWYGPVFQVRNFYEQGPISRIGALYQCASHEWYIPVLMKHLPFVGGTNLLCTRKLVERVGGYDSSTLTEDVEFGVRVYCMTGHWPVYIPYWSTEQTPAAYRAFFRQRLRWGSGHLQVTDKYREAKGLYPEDRRRQMVQALYLKGEGEWMLYQGAFLVTVSLMVAALRGLLDLSSLPLAVLLALRGFLLVYVVFTAHLYLRYRRFMAPPAGRARWWPRARVLLELLCLPVISPFLLFPYSWALVLKWTRRQPQVWVKTPRTAEVHGKVA